MNLEEQVKSNKESIDHLLELQKDQEITTLTQNVLIQLLSNFNGITNEQSVKLYNVLRNKIDLGISTGLEDYYPEIVSSLFSVSQEDLLLALHDTEDVIKDLFD